MLRSVVCGGLVGLACFAIAPKALAGGYEYTAPGTRALGRGGAFHARADDPMALLYNPANLAVLTGSQFLFNAQLAWEGRCADRAGEYGVPPVSDPDFLPTTDIAGTGRFADGNADAYADVAFPKVCNSGPFSPGGSALIYTLRLNPEWGLGFGVLTPSAVGHTNWGSSDGTVRVGGEELPSPLRYVLVEEFLIQIYPTIGVGYAPTSWFRAGLTLQWGLAHYTFRNYSVATPGEDVGGDIESEIKALDWFLPRVSASVHFVPHDNLDVMLGFLWSDEAHAKGDVKVRADAFTDNPIPTTLKDVTIRAPQGWWAAFGIRYADRISSRPRDPDQVSRLSGRVEDNMASERWDIEFNAVYEFWSNVDSLDLTFPEDSEIRTSFGSVRVPEEIVLAHEWKDQIGLRLGGDYNIMPGLAAVRAGVSFETRGVKPSLAQVDFLPAQRIGIHTGLTMRVGRFDISLAYAHIFQESITVTAQDARLRQIAAIRDSHDGSIVNAGTYTSNFDVFALSLDYHFR